MGDNIIGLRIFVKIKRDCLAGMPPRTRTRTRTHIHTHTHAHTHAHAHTYTHVRKQNLVSILFLNMFWFVCVCLLFWRHICCNHNTNADRCQIDVWAGWMGETSVCPGGLEWLQAWRPPPGGTAPGPRPPPRPSVYRRTSRPYNHAPPAAWAPPYWARTLLPHSYTPGLWTS